MAWLFGGSAADGGGAGRLSASSGYSGGVITGSASRSSADEFEDPFATSASAPSASAAPYLQPQTLTILPPLTAEPAAAVAAVDVSDNFLMSERRGLWGQTSYNVGYSYFTGLALGGLVGALQGIRKSPNRMPRVILNSLLNGSGKYGARAGNSMGVLSTLYTLVSDQLQDSAFIQRAPHTIERYTPIKMSGEAERRREYLVPMTAAFISGVLFVTPRAMELRGIERRYASWPKRLTVLTAGGVVSVLGFSLFAYLGPMVYGHRSPFHLGPIDMPPDASMAGRA